MLERAEWNEAVPLDPGFVGDADVAFSLDNQARCVLRREGLDEVELSANLRRKEPLERRNRSARGARGEACLPSSEEEWWIGNRNHLARLHEQLGVEANLLRNRMNVRNKSDVTTTGASGVLDRFLKGAMRTELNRHTHTQGELLGCSIAAGTLLEAMHDHGTCY